MTPAVKTLQDLQVEHLVHQYEHDSKVESYGLEALEKLNVEPSKVYKTLVAQTSAAQLLVAVVPVERKLNFKRLAAVVNAKKVNMAPPALVTRSTGYQLGGVSPIGQKNPLPTVIDDSALVLSTVFISAGKRGLELELNPKDLVALTKASVAHIAD